MSRLLIIAVLLSGAVLAQQRDATPVRQNPNIDRPITNEGTTSPLADALQKLVAVYGPIAVSNDRPNPYTRIEPWGDIPPGNNGDWAAVIAAADFERKLELSFYAGGMDIDRDAYVGWKPTTKKKGPGRRLPKKKRKNRAKIRKL